MKLRGRVSLSAIAIAAIVFSTSLPGCGSDVPATGTVNGEVKIVPPKDSSGKDISLEGEVNPKAAPRK